MLSPFLIAFRETLQCVLIVLLILSHPAMSTQKQARSSLIKGLFLGLLAGFSLGFFPFFNKHLSANEAWAFWRHATATILFYSSIAVLFMRRTPPSSVISTILALLGFQLVFFEARGAGFIFYDVGLMTEQLSGAFISGAGGFAAALAAVFIVGRYVRRLPLQKAFTIPSLLMAVGALQFSFGGVAELERENILIPLQRGLISFLADGMRSLQTLLFITAHPFLDVPHTGLAQFLSGDRMAMTLAVFFLVAPPLTILISYFSDPDPLIETPGTAARKRYTLAVFRKGIIYHSTPVLIVLSVLIFLLHAVNVSFNPLYEPSPLPVRDSDSTGTLRVFLSDKTGDFNDKKLRKFVYYHENKQIVFIAMLKPDGSVGIGLDECEICRPADWNVDAKGYAQRGEHLVCKYCMTPIATATLNNPGGCNPIPLSFTVKDQVIILSVSELVSTYKKVQEMEKKGTHL